MARERRHLRLSPGAKTFLEKYVHARIQKKTCSVVNLAEKLALITNKSRISEDDVTKAILLSERKTSKKQLAEACLLFLFLASICTIAAFGIFFIVYQRFPTEFYGATIIAGGITAGAGLYVLVVREGLT